MAWYGSQVMDSGNEQNSKFARGAWLRALERTAALERDPHLTLPILVDQWAERYDGATALISAEGSLSYRGLAARANQFARWGLAQGLRAGDVVTLLMPNCAEYVAAWIGLSRLGVSVALINTQLVGVGLAHCLRIVAPKCAIVAGELAEQFEAVRGEACIPCAWLSGAVRDGFSALDAALARLPGGALAESECPSPAIDLTALYIYTSGTTGLPKAARVSHYRVMQWIHWFSGLLDTQPSDRMYDCLPLYHSVGGVVAVGATLVGGGSVVIRRRFSASDFWRDVAATGCTLFQYIGELCRYLVNARACPEELEHRLRIACGNGLRRDVWEAFQSRFKIPRVLEYYASTEGNFSLYNCEGRVGAIGRIPPYLAARMPVSLLRFDFDRGEPLRNPQGFCEPCGVDEVGEAVGLIPPAQQRNGRFEGYIDAAASERKVLCDVFKPGDRWFRTGDLMRRDAAGFFYFEDRVGDTYRWKGENVSTAEVMAVVAEAPGVVEAVVFGVIVPGAEGRAGMAALVAGPSFDLAEVRKHLHARLPKYARPLFLRLVQSVEKTGTFKPRTRDFMLAGFDPAASHDPLYFDDPRGAAYVPIDAALYRDLAGGKIAL
jgi:fatty-acyl-CoA synthase